MAALHSSRLPSSWMDALLTWCQEGSGQAGKPSNGSLMFCVYHQKGAQYSASHNYNLGVDCSGGWLFGVRWVVQGVEPRTSCVESPQPSLLRGCTWIVRHAWTWRGGGGYNYKMQSMHLTKHKQIMLGIGSSSSCRKPPLHRTLG